MWDTNSFESFLPLTDDLQEMTTSRGKFRRFFYQFRWIICPMAVLMIPFTVLTIIFSFGFWEVLPPPLESKLLLPSQELQNDPSLPYSTLSFRNGVLKIYGDGSKLVHNFPMTTSTAYFQYFDEFPGIEVSLAALGQNMSTSIHSIEIKWFKLNGLQISNELQAFPELEKLKLENVSIIEFFQPVSLLKLREFFLYQILEDQQNNIEDYKVQNYYNISNTTNHFLDRTFFFMGEQFSSFIPALRSTRVNISVWLDGSMIFSRDIKNHEIRLSLRTCHPILFPPLPNISYDRVTLANCNDLQSNSISPFTKTLELYLLHRDSVSSALLHGILQKLTKLEELFLELPEGGVVLNLDSLPPSLRLLSVSSMPINITNTLTSSRRLQFSKLTKFYFGSSNQYSWINELNRSGTKEELNPFILSNFNKIFPNLEEAGIFEVQNDGRYDFLEMLLNSSAKVITVQGFLRSDSLTSEHQLEIRLDVIGISKSSQFFELRKFSNELKGRSLDYNEQIERRYWMLGWSSVDSWEKYVHVRSLIDNGFFLG